MIVGVRDSESAVMFFFFFAKLKLDMSLLVLTKSAPHYTVQRVLMYYEGVIYC